MEFGQKLKQTQLYLEDSKYEKSQVLAEKVELAQQLESSSETHSRSYEALKVKNHPVKERSLWSAWRICERARSILYESNSCFLKHKYWKPIINKLLFLQLHSCVSESSSKTTQHIIHLPKNDVKISSQLLSTSEKQFMQESSHKIPVGELEQRLQPAGTRPTTKKQLSEQELSEEKVRIKSAGLMDKFAVSYLVLRLYKPHPPCQTQLVYLRKLRFQLSLLQKTHSTSPISL